MGNTIGYEATAITLEALFDLIHPDDQPVMLKLTNALGEICTRDTTIEVMCGVFQVDFRLRKADGSYIKVLRQTSLLTRDERGSVVLSLGIYTDISYLNRDNTIHFGITIPPYDNLLRQQLALQEINNVNLTLSPREKELVNLLIQGKGTQAIAETLHIASHTVETHRKNIKGKLGVKNTPELISLVLKQAALVA